MAWSPCERCREPDGRFRAVPCPECRAALHRAVQGLRGQSVLLRADADRLRQLSLIRVKNAEEILRRLASRCVARQTSATRTPGRGALAGLRVLVVEDDPFIRDAVSLLLASEGVRVVEAENGLQALGVLDRHSVDVVLCDLRMPQLDGRELVRRLRADRRLARTPVVAVSALAGVEPGGLVGFDGYLAKPFDAQSLLEALARIRSRPAA